jgi:dihydrofolate reductase
VSLFHTRMRLYCMRKIIESTLVSLDGVIGNPPTWVRDYLDDDFEKDALDRLLESDAMLMGRRTYEMFVNIWSARTDAYASRINSMRKYVFSSTLEKADWKNTTIIRGDVVAEVRMLKQQAGQDLVIYGHGLLGQTLLKHGLLDEFRVSIFPVLVGRGKLLFRDDESTTLKLVATERLRTGVVVLRYQPAEPIEAAA